MRDHRAYDWEYGEVFDGRLAARSSSVRRAVPRWQRDTTRIEIGVIAFVILYVLAHLVWWAVRGMP